MIILALEYREIESLRPCVVAAAMQPLSTLKPSLCRRLASNRDHRDLLTLPKRLFEIVHGGCVISHLNHRWFLAGDVIF